MLRLARFPPDHQEMGDWFATHEAEWLSSRAFRFSILEAGTMIGVIDIDEVDRGDGELGYWLDQAFWSHGYATEAATALVGFAFGDVGLHTLRAGHAVDNPASARVLAKLGFRPVDEVTVWSRSRGESIRQRRCVLSRPDVSSG